MSSTCRPRGYMTPFLLRVDDPPNRSGVDSKCQGSGPLSVPVCRVHSPQRSSWAMSQRHCSLAEPLHASIRGVGIICEVICLYRPRGVDTLFGEHLPLRKAGYKHDRALIRESEHPDYCHGAVGRVWKPEGSRADALKNFLFLPCGSISAEGGTPANEINIERRRAKDGTKS